MDGNRRWAKDQGRPTLEGHRKGAETFTEIARAIRDAHTPHAVFYAFSTENWHRSEEEVAYLMDLFEEFLDRADKELKDNDEKKVHIKVVGRTDDFPAHLQKRIAELEEKDAEIEADTTIWVALSYGGRAEIVAAVNHAITKGEAVDEESFNNLLWSGDMPDPDIIIRTSGEQRLSNFMTWKSVYSELFFTDTKWPAFTKEELYSILDSYNERQRRKGK
tara:strand:- start:607 stop:1263 length:657 start_codon:yes stop_codon:yes gene_type:complete